MIMRDSVEAAEVAARVLDRGGLVAIPGVTNYSVVADARRDAAVARGETGNYFPIFLAASLAYILAVGIVQLLAPKLEVADVEAKPVPA